SSRTTGSRIARASAAATNRARSTATSRSWDVADTTPQWPSQGGESNAELTATATAVGASWQFDAGDGSVSRERRLAFQEGYRVGWNARALHTAPASPTSDDGSGRPSAPDLAVEVNAAHKDLTLHVGGAMGTPAIDGEYWLLRVRVSPKQSVVAFEKFGTLGIGFQKEKDWNATLPWTCAAEGIYKHIAHNRAGANPEKCREAVKMLQAFIFK